MGYGAGLVEVPFGPEVLRETTTTSVFMAAFNQGHLGLVLYAVGHTPVAAEIVFPGLVLPASHPYGGDLYGHLPPGGEAEAASLLDTYHERRRSTNQPAPTV